VPPPIEDGVTFAENALVKARAVCAATGLATIADDSGLAVAVMGGAPGIFSALWSGAHGADEENLRLLLAQLIDIPDAHRGAAFVCAAALVTPGGQEVVCEGRMEGRIATEAAGGGGFGYDPIFIPAGFDVTAAELTAAQKNSISHRGKAFTTLAPHLAAL
jgi:XTP/dITP diphosphohydrolase